MVGGVEYTFLIHVVGGVEYSLPCISFTKGLFFIFIFLSGKFPSLLSVIIIILFIYLLVAGLFGLGCGGWLVLNFLLLINWSHAWTLRQSGLGGFLGDYIMFSLLLD